MLGLFGSLSLGARSLQAQQEAVEVAGHNLANVNNPAYARQRLILQTTPAIPTALGPQGTGADGVDIQRVRSVIVDNQIQNETSVRGFLESYQQALQYAQAGLGQQIDRRATGAEGAAAASGVGAQHSIADGLNDLFNAFQSVSTQPTSIVERQILVLKANELALQFNQIDERLGNVVNVLNESLQNDVLTANQLLQEIARLNEEIGFAETTTGANANDLRDTRQQRIEQLAELVNIEAVESNKQLTISIGGTQVLSGKFVTDPLETFDAGGGQLLVRTGTTGTVLNMDGGRIQGTISVRDNEVASLRNNLDQLANLIVSEINAVHATGFNLGGTNGNNFFEGTTAGTMKVNAAIFGNPSLIQASAVAGDIGNNEIILKMAQLTTKGHATLANQTFTQYYGQNVALLGQALSGVNTQLVDQEIVENMLNRQRESISGVSVDEEVADLVRFQKAYQASAKFLTTVDEMMDTVINIKR